MQKFMTEDPISTYIPQRHTGTALGGGVVSSLHTLWSLNTHVPFLSPMLLSHPPGKAVSFPFQLGAAQRPQEPLAKAALVCVCEQITPVIWPCRKLQFCSSWKIKILSGSDGRKRMRQLKWTQPLLIRHMINYTFAWLRGSMENLKEKNQRRN